MSALRDAVSGAKWGLIMAGLLCAWILVLSLLSGSIILKSRTGTAYHAGSIMLVYIGGGASIGALLGVLRPLLRYPAGAMLVGVGAAVPLAAAIAVSRLGFAGWTRTETIAVLVFALAFGGPGGLIVRAFMLDAEKRRGR